MDGEREEKGEEKEKEMIGLKESYVPEDFLRSRDVFQLPFHQLKPETFIES